jgi:hypothetical protein
MVGLASQLNDLRSALKWVNKNFIYIYKNDVISGHFFQKKNQKLVDPRSIHHLGPGPSRPQVLTTGLTTLNLTKLTQIRAIKRYDLSNKSPVKMHQYQSQLYLVWHYGSDCFLKYFSLGNASK